MYSLRYGTLPIVRATGGLEDTVSDASEPGGNGFKFREYSPAGARRRPSGGRWSSSASPAEWRKMQQDGMKLDFSWDASAREYVKVYEGALAAAQTTP